MSRRLAQPALLLILPLLGAGCCATNQLWNFAREDPIHLEAASITEDDVLHLALHYDNGEAWLVTAQLERGVEWPETLARRIRLLDGPLPPSARRLTKSPVSDEEDLVSVWFTYHHAPDSALSHTVWVTGGGYEVVVDLPAPLDWSRGITQLGVLLLPLAAVVDAVCAPIWYLWCFATAGCHGPCWIPWCEEFVPSIRRR